LQVARRLDETNCRLNHVFEHLHISAERAKQEETESSADSESERAKQEETESSADSESFCSVEEDALSTPSRSRQDLMSIRRENDVSERDHRHTESPLDTRENESPKTFFHVAPQDRASAPKESNTAPSSELLWL
jgi:hypothetical protein